MDETERELLLKEQEELNAWARLVAQVYFTWFTFFITLNGAALAVVFSKTSTLPSNALIFRSICGIFATWSVTATLSSAGVAFYATNVDKKIRQVYIKLHQGLGDDWTGSKGEWFLVPVTLAIAVLSFNALATLLLVVFWSALAFIGHL